MSRIGKQPITIPQGVQVTVNGNEVTVKGPKGELKRKVHPDITVTLKDNSIVVTRPS
ncbi:MAG: 50S ribosomal protein L6, partial [Dehalococcoidia bacterium]|nr:50S ribosomal protein L6 [Dehalococcoidia bacterium]